jgi:hypothetical protein
MGGEAGDVPQPVSRSPLVGPRFPLVGHPSRRRSGAYGTAVLGAPLAVLTAASVVGNLLASRLLSSHPLVLVALAPRAPYLAVAAGHAPFAAFVAVAVLRLCAADPSHFLLGRRHGARAAAALERRRPLAALWNRLGLVLVAASPSGKVLVLAGASRLPHRRVASAAVAGTLAQVVALYVAGRVVADAVGAPARALAAAAPAVVVAGAGVTVGAAVAARSRRGPGRRADAPQGGERGRAFPALAPQRM